jgi:hypothetical protein
MLHKPAEGNGPIEIGDHPVAASVIWLYVITTDRSKTVEKWPGGGDV